MHTPSLARLRASASTAEDWQGVGELMLASAQQAGSDRRGFPDLPRQHDSSGAALHSGALAAALAAHRRGRRRARRAGARLHAPGPDRDALAGRQRGLPGEAGGARAGISAPEPMRNATRSTASSWTSWSTASSGPTAVACFQRVIGRMKDEGCDAVDPRLHRDPADHQRRQLAACRRWTPRACSRGRRCGKPSVAIAMARPGLDQEGSIPPAGAQSERRRQMCRRLQRVGDQASAIGEAAGILSALATPRGSRCGSAGIQSSAEHTPASALKAHTSLQSP